MKAANFSKIVSEWYQTHQRTLPWRLTRDPYSIWISEIILQQTRVNQGLPYYDAFIRKYPTLRDLARAKPEDVLRLWQGLGYYSRARNLMQCAQVINSKWKGIFPQEFEVLKQLPGIGSYTAAAIASIAFNQPVAVVDGNVYRVLARVFGIATDISSTSGRKEFSKLANELIAGNDPGIHNQAIMEFGALQCVPTNPACGECPLKNVCKAFKHGMQGVLPVKVRKSSVRVRHLIYLLIQHQGKIFMRERTGKDIWRGLYELPLIETLKPGKLIPIIRKTLGESWSNRLAEPRSYKHLLTHQHLQVTIVELRTPGGTLPRPVKASGGTWYTLREAARLPKPALLVKDFRARGIL